RDTFVALEYQVPYNDSRIDCLLFGKSNSSGNVLLIELKQWANVEALPESGNFVETYTGGLERIVAHPSQQVRGYYRYLMGFIAAFEGTGSLELFGCAYCHNYEKRQGQGLFAPIYEPVLKDYPLYGKADMRALAEELKRRLSAGHGFEIFNRFIQSPVRP